MSDERYDAEGMSATSPGTLTALPRPAREPLSSSVRKAQIREALFNKAAPVRVGRFILLERLGSGAMGEVYAAYDEQLDRRVAVKLVRSDVLADRADELLRREGQTLAQVSHPNVVQVYETGFHGGRLFIAMELVRGKTLTRTLTEMAAWPPARRNRETLRRFVAAGRGLEAAHDAGLAHRDFKPDNVLVGDDGRVRVVDFGLARALAAGSAPPHGSAVPRVPVAPKLVCFDGATLSASPSARHDSLGQESAPVATAGSLAAGPKATAATRLTQTGHLMGTPSFMAPEQLRGELADQRSDQFSFCVALYRALYGAPPFPGPDIEGRLLEMQTRPPACEKAPGISKRARQALRRGLSFDAGKRFNTMGELLAALQPRISRPGTWIPAAIAIIALVLVCDRTARRPGPCDHAGTEIERAWSPLRRSITQVGFARSGLPETGIAWDASRRNLDRYALAWRSASVDACQATYVRHTRSELQFTRAAVCLQQLHGQLDALVTELGRGSAAAAQQAVEASEALPLLSSCDDAVASLYGASPPPPWLASQVAALRAELARAHALNLLGQKDEALAIARPAIAKSQQLGYLPVHAEALYETARGLDDRLTAATRDEAQALYFDALDVAEASRHDQLAADIWNRLVLLSTRMDASLDQALAWWHRYQAAVRRLTHNARAQAELKHLRARIHYLRGELDGAEIVEREAIAALGPDETDSLDASSYYHGLATALVRRNQGAEAIRLERQATEIVLAKLGAAHPRSFKLVMSYGEMLLEQGDLEGARKALNDALAAVPAAYVDGHQDGARLHGYLADLAAREGRLAEALVHAQASLRIYQATGAPETRRAEGYTAIGTLESKSEHFESALESFRSALALQRGALRGPHDAIAISEGAVAETLVMLRRYAEAEAHALEAKRIVAAGASEDRDVRGWLLLLEGEILVGKGQLARAVPVLEAAMPELASGDDANAGRAMWALAQALRATDAGRAVELAQGARVRLHQSQPPTRRYDDAIARFLTTPR